MGFLDPAIIRTENATILWSEENQFGMFMPPPPNAFWSRFGIFEEMTMPMPQEAWTPYFSYAGLRSRADIFPGRISMAGSIPNIRIQRGSPFPGSQAFTVLSMAIGHIDLLPPDPNTGIQFIRILENSDEIGFDGRVPSFNIFMAPRATDGSQPVAFQWTGVKINNWSLTASEGGVLMLNVDEMIPTTLWHSIVGTNGFNAAVQPIPDPGDANDGQFFFVGATLLVGNIPFARVKSFTLSGSNQLDPRYYLSTRAELNQLDLPPPVFQFPNDLPEGKRTYALSLELDVVSPTFDTFLFAAMLNEGRDLETGVVTGYPITLQFQNQDGFASPYSYTLSINCSPRQVPPPGFPGNPPAAVGTAMGFNLPAPPQGYWDGRLNLDLDSIYIDFRII